MKKAGNEFEVDFVVPWVDGNDPIWQAERAAYCGEDRDNRSVRYRDYDLFQYWFRGVEQYANWIRKIHLITYGHLPIWLNTKHPKLNIVNHKDYIPKKYLPTFNSHTIELNLHRIQGLSEHFVYFNDDIFIVDKVRREDFFANNGLPCSGAGLSFIQKYDSRTFADVMYNSFRLMERHFYPRDVLKSEWRNFINIKYGFRRNISTLCLFPWCNDFFPGLRQEHGPNPYLSKTIVDVWNCEREYLDSVCRHKFRSSDDVSQMIFLWWQWCKGDFKPRNERSLYIYQTIGSDINLLINLIKRPKYPVLVLNDIEMDDDKYLEHINTLKKAFQTRFPQKSSFEL